MKLFAHFILSIAFYSLQAQVIDSSFAFIPQPKKIEISAGEFNFHRSCSIQFSSQDSFSVSLIQTAIKHKFGQQFTRAKAENAIRLIKASAEELAMTLPSKKITLPFELGQEGYIISIQPKAIEIIAHTDAGIFYGTQTLLQLIQSNLGSIVSCMNIYDKPDMAMRGWQDDISRGPIPTLDFLKEEIRRMASFKLNTFTLYTEHVFKLKKHPSIAPADGITEEEIKELSTFAKNYHIDIIGNFQSFGHFKNILQVPGYESLGESKTVLSPAKEESYRFLSDVYNEIAPAYSSPYFHINCDEVGLGNGPSKVLIDSIGMEGVYARHINRIDSLLKPYHKHIMMWGDIAVKHPKIIEQLPKDMIIVSWGYAEMESMEEDILPFVQSGFEFIVAPGVNCWSRIYPDMERANINIYNYLRDGYKHHALGFINTTWDDDGQNLFNNNWYSLIWGAECGWNAPVSAPVNESEQLRKKRLATFNQAYNEICFGTDSDVTALLWATSNLKNGAIKNCLSTASLWNPLLPDNTYIPSDFEQENKNLLKKMDSLETAIHKSLIVVRSNALELELLLFSLGQARVVIERNLLGVKLKNATRTGTATDLADFKNDFTALTDSIKQLQLIYDHFWKLENRSWWLDTVNVYYQNFEKSLTDLQYVCLIRAADTLTQGKRKITLRSVFNNHPVYYSTEGSSPTPQSFRYSQPFFVDTAIHLKARVIDQGLAYPISEDSLIFHQGIGALQRLNSEWSSLNTAYAAGGKYALLDGRRGSRTNFNDGLWQAYFGNDLDITLDFGKPILVTTLTIGFAQLMRYGILFPQQIEISTSTDGLQYTLTKTEKNTINPNTELRSTHDYVIPLAVNTRYLKLVARNTPVLPEWHYAKGKTGWLFADEIMVD